MAVPGEPGQGQYYHAYGADGKVHLFLGGQDLGVDFGLYNLYGQNPNTPSGAGGSSGGGSSGGGGGGSGGGGGGPALVTNAGQKLTQAQLDALYISYRQLGNIYGYNITDAMGRALAMNDVGTTELQTRLGVIKTISDNKTYFDAYEQALKARGIAGKFDWKDRVSFILGQAPAKFYNTWNEAATAGSLEQAGFTVAGQAAHGEKQTEYQDLTLGRGDVLHLEAQLGLSPSKVADVTQLAQTTSQLASIALRYMPASRYGSAGLTKTDLENIVTNTADAITNDKFNRLVKQEQDFSTRQRASVGAQSIPGGGTAPAATLQGISG